MDLLLFLPKYFFSWIFAVAYSDKIAMNKQTLVSYAVITLKHDSPFLSRVSMQCMHRARRHPSVRPSNAGIVSKQMDISSHFDSLIGTSF